MQSRQQQPRSVHASTDSHLDTSQRIVTTTQSDKASTSQPHAHDKKKGNQVAPSHLPHYSGHWKGFSRGGGRSLVVENSNELTGSCYSLGPQAAQPG